MQIKTKKTDEITQQTFSTILHILLNLTRYRQNKNQKLKSCNNPSMKPILNSSSHAENCLTEYVTAGEKVTRQSN